MGKGGVSVTEFMEGGVVLVVARRLVVAGVVCASVSAGVVGAGVTLPIEVGALPGMLVVVVTDGRRSGTRTVPSSSVASENAKKPMTATATTPRTQSPRRSMRPSFRLVMHRDVTLSKIGRHAQVWVRQDVHACVLPHVATAETSDDDGNQHDHRACHGATFGAGVVGDEVDDRIHL